ncbi:acetyl-coenzyme A synthetase N-terminal domain-containing protein [Microbulbifer sp. TB1203]|uniref:acetyl-coenzyme A synthetase N-terminal domain-containing protein n=1 Tax=unclassified Microbulbifer TaxID=2619833 RepID=UPI0035B2808C
MQNAGNYMTEEAPCVPRNGPSSPRGLAGQSLMNEADYFEQYSHSINDNEGFWREQGRRLDWIRPCHPSERRILRQGRPAYPLRAIYP